MLISGRCSFQATFTFNFTLNYQVMLQQLKDFPFDIQISFHKVIEEYQKELDEIESEISREYMQKMLDHVSEFPELSEGFSDPKLLMGSIKASKDDILKKQAICKPKLKGCKVRLPRTTGKQVTNRLRS